MVYYGKISGNLDLMKQILYLFLMMTLLGSGSSSAFDLKPFQTDGCSSFPDGPPSEPDKWRNCCLEHDKAYWLGGTYLERKQADNKLRSCIAEVENKALADIMWAGVRAGGSPYWPTHFRWSYGWPYTRGYQAVTEEERKLAIELLENDRQH